MPGSPKKAGSYMEPSKKFYYQENDIDKIPYAGPEQRRRANDRPRLSQEGQEVVDAVRELVDCRSGCVLPKELINSLGHVTGELKKAGDGSISRGINKFVSVHEESDEFFTGIKATKSRAWSTLVYGMVLAMLGWIGIKLYKG